MPHHLGPHRKVEVIIRKVFEDFGCCDDPRAWKAACEDQRNDSWVEICVEEPYGDGDPEMEYLRQWLLRNGASEQDGYVLLGISW